MRKPKKSCCNNNALYDTVFCALPKNHEGLHHEGVISHSRTWDDAGDEHDLVYTDVTCNMCGRSCSALGYDNSLEGVFRFVNIVFGICLINSKFLQKLEIENLMGKFLSNEAGTPPGQ